MYVFLKWHFVLAKIKKNWPRHNLDNCIYKGTSQTDFLISLPCKCHLNYNELRAIVTLFHVTFQDPARALLSHPVGLDFHTEAGFDFSDFFPLPNPSEIFRDVTIWFYPIYCMFIQGIIRKKLYV